MGVGNLSALRNTEASVNQGVICTGLYRQVFGTMQTLTKSVIHEVGCTVFVLHFSNF